MSDEIEFRAKVELPTGEVETWVMKITEDDNEDFILSSRADDGYHISLMEGHLEAGGINLLEPITKHYGSKV